MTEPKPRVLFLDFDGVLNSYGSHALNDHGANPPPLTFHLDDRNINEGDREEILSGARNLDAHNVAWLRYLLEKVPDLKIVLSTSWRVGEPLWKIQAILACRGVDASRVIGATPSVHGRTGRHDEIRAWLNANTFERAAAIDDAPMDVTVLGECKYLQTNEYTGMTYLNAEELIKWYRPEWIMPMAFL